MAKLKMLRAQTGSPLNHCKTALAENDNDIEKSKEFLRKKGLADAEKRSSRSATEGLIGLDQDGDAITMIQFSCETDFVAKTDRFRDGIKGILATLAGQDSLAVSGAQSDDAQLLESIISGTTLTASLDPDTPTQSLEDGIKFTASKTQENCQLARVFKQSWDSSAG